MTIFEMGQALRRKQVSAVELAEEALAGVARNNPDLNAFLTVTGESGRARARSLDDDLARGVDRGPLHGIPIAHKDAFNTKGVRTTAGSKIFVDRIPDYDADLVAKLHNAGAVMIGKTNLHELCYGVTSTNPHFGPVRNPWDPERIPGGSSGGSAAAVAAGVVPLATGTDTGGSIRIPASFCGIVGLKPTYGRLSTEGVIPLGYTLDHVGPLTQTVRDAAIAFHASLGKSGVIPPAEVDLRELRIGVPKNFFFDRLDPEVMGSIRSAVQTAAALGALMIEVPVPDIEALNAVGRFVLMAEVATVWRRYLDHRADFGEDVLMGIQQGLLITAADYLDAQRLRRILSEEFSKVWERVDCLLTPSTPTPAPKIGETMLSPGGVTQDLRVVTTRLVRPFNVLGWPALSLPCGLSKDGLPIGLQLVAPPHGENVLLRACAALEDALGFASRYMAKR